MLFDLIDFTPIVIQVIVGAILLMGILKGLKDGIIVMGVRVGMYVVIFLAIKFLTPTVSNLLSNIGFLDGLIEKIASINVIGELYGTLAAEAIYSIIAGIVILVIGLIVTKIVVKLLKSIILRRNKGCCRAFCFCHFNHLLFYRFNLYSHFLFSKLNFM